MNKVTIHCDVKFWPDRPVAACGKDTKSSSHHRVVKRGDFKEYECSAWEIKCVDCERLVR